MGGIRNTSVETKRSESEIIICNRTAASHFVIITFPSNHALPLLAIGIIEIERPHNQIDVLYSFFLPVFELVCTVLRR